MRTKEEIMKDTGEREVKMGYNIRYSGMSLVIELLCDIRDDQINHNRKMEHLVENLR